MVQANQILETVLYAEDLDAAVKFYTEGFGLKLLSQNELMVVLGIGNHYLLIFDPRKSSLIGRMVPSHGTSGEGHIAFVANASELSAWRNRLKSAGIQIESEVTWDGGQRGMSIYVRDPAGNSVELAPPNLWCHLEQ
jgi:catechol 2,3-dioxygenase-like lactoylglutathione lyase family enzyme